MNSIEKHFLVEQEGDAQTNLSELCMYNNSSNVPWLRGAVDIASTEDQGSNPDMVSGF
jgi:hypothetical protein